MLGNSQLLCEDRPVTLGLRQQDQKIRVVQNVGDGRACQQVFHILREGAGDAALFTEHLPNGHKVAGSELVPQQDMELVKVAPCLSLIHISLFQGLSDSFSLADLVLLEIGCGRRQPSFVVDVYCSIV